MSMSMRRVRRLVPTPPGPSAAPSVEPREGGDVSLEDCLRLMGPLLTTRVRAGVVEDLHKREDQVMTALTACNNATNIPPSEWPTSRILPDVAKAGAVRLALAAMNSLSESATILTVATTTLRQLSRNDDNKKIMMRENAIQRLVKAASGHPMVSQIQENTCSVLGNLAHFAENIKSIMESGGLSLVVAAMGNHPAHASINHIGSIVIKSLADQKGRGPENSHKELIKQGVAGALTAVLKHLPDQDTPVLWACRAARVLSSSSSGKQSLLDAGFSAAVLEALPNMSKATVAEALSPDLMRGFMSTTTSARHIIATSTILAVIAVYSTYTSSLPDPSLAALIQPILARQLEYCKLDADLRSSIMKAGSPLAVCMALNSNKGDLEVARWALGTLMQYAFDWRKREEMGADGISIELVGNVMSLHAGDESVQELGLGLFWVSSFRAATRPRISGVAMVIGAAKSKFDSNPRISERVRAIEFLLTRTG